MGGTVRPFLARTFGVLIVIALVATFPAVVDAVGRPVEPLAVVGEEEHYGLIVDAQPGEPVEEDAQCSVSCGDLAVVGKRITAAVRLGWIVGCVGLEEMKKKKERLPRLLVPESAAEYDPAWIEPGFNDSAWTPATTLPSADRGRGRGSDHRLQVRSRPG